jgi:hypothetical protein
VDGFPAEAAMNRYIKHKSIALTVCLIATAFVSFRPSPERSTTQLPLEQAKPVAHRVEPQQLIDIFGDKDTSYNGYEMKRLTKTINDETSGNIEVSYAVLMKNDRQLLKFDGGIYFGLGNSTEFGLFDLLGNGSQQFIVSQTVPRGGQHWVVSVSPSVRVLFASGNYGVGREEFYVIDLDKDGIFEISLPVTAFYEMQDKMSMAEIPLPEIIFKYDPKQQKYLPANHLFPDYVLRDVERDIEGLRNEESYYLSTRLNILLRYIYARKATEGWAFFDREYRRPNKQEIKARTLSVLKNARIYK